MYNASPCEAGTGAAGATVMVALLPAWMVYDAVLLAGGRYMLIVMGAAAGCGGGEGLGLVA